MNAPKHVYSRWLLSLAVPVACIGSAKPADDAEERWFGRLFSKALTTIEEEHLNPPPRLDMARLGIEALYAKFGKKMPLDLKRRLLRPNNPKPKDLENLLTEAHVRLGDRHKFSDDQVFEICIDAVMATLDLKNGSAYLRPATVQPLGGGPNHFEVGLKLETDPATKMLRVATPVFKGPSYTSGLRAGDVITHIRIENKVRNNDTWESFSTKGMSIEQADKLLLGPEGTRVTIVAIPAKAR